MGDRTLLEIVQSVCAVVGVARPTSVFGGINANRTMFEMLELANETAQRIAYDTREWGFLTIRGEIIGDGISQDYNLPNNFKRFLLTSNLWRGASPSSPMRFIPDPDEWVRRRLSNMTESFGEWRFYTSQISIVPILAMGEKVTFTYLDKNCIMPMGNPDLFADVFQNDTDKWRLDDRLLKLGMIWAWKAQKGSPYAEDMANYQEALSYVSGADKPAPIIIGRMPISAAVNVALPWPSNWGPQ
jgi:hypothetical protein